MSECGRCRNLGEARLRVSRHDDGMRVHRAGGYGEKAENQRSVWV